MLGPNLMAKAVVLNANEVTRVVPMFGASLGAGDSIVIVAADAKVKVSDMYDGKVFSDNPNLAEMLLTEEKKKELLASLQSIDSMQDLKDVVAKANADINPIE